MAPHARLTKKRQQGSGVWTTGKLLHLLNCTESRAYFCFMFFSPFLLNQNSVVVVVGGSFLLKLMASSVHKKFI
jgi:hypothetical protein